MDAEARTNTRVLAAVPPHGATWAEIARTSGIRGEALDGVLNGLVAAHVLDKVARYGGYIYRPRLTVPDKPDRVPKEPKRSRRTRAEWTAEFNARCLDTYALRKRGMTLQEIAHAQGIAWSTAQHRIQQARRLLRRQGKPV